MPQYLRIADNIYRHFEEEKKFNVPLQDCLNFIVKQLREELKDTDLKLLYNYIDFVEGFQDKNKDEFVLWLAGFIERITEGGVKRLPPIHEEIPAEFTFERDLSIILDKLKTSSAEQIKSYFESDEYKNN
jgi:hypothetical protein